MRFLVELQGMLTILRQKVCFIVLIENSCIRVNEEEVKGARIFCGRQLVEVSVAETVRRCLLGNSDIDVSILTLNLPSSSIDFWNSSVAT